jgi:hypothetical protein
MTSKSFSQNSTSKSFEKMSSGVTDLSELAKDSLLGHSSMSGGNTITAKEGPEQMGTPGTPSELTGTSILGKELDANHVTDPTSIPVTDHVRKAKDHG